MSKLIDYLEKAKKEGLKGGQTGNPPPHATDPCPIEVGYSVSAQKLFNIEKEKFLKDEVHISQKLSDVESAISSADSDLINLHLVDNLEERIEAKLLESSNSHIMTMKDYFLKESELKRFKIENDLQRDAHYPPSIHTHLSWIVIILATESIINAYFFSNNTGLLGGALIALAFSLINIILGLTTGHFFTYKNSKKYQYLGLAAFLIGFSIIIWLNSVTGTARSLTEIAKLNNTEVWSPDLWKSALNDGAQIFLFKIPFKDQNGFLLFFLGLISGIFAIYKGYTVLDPFPGYAQVHKRFKKAEEKKNEIEKDCKKLADQVVSDLKKQRKETINKIQTLGKNISQIQKDFRNKVIELEAKKKDIESDYKQIIVVYRNSVRAVTPVGVPEYFHNEPNPGLVINRELINETISKIEILAEKINLMVDKIQDIQAQINSLDASKSKTLSKIKEFFKDSQEIAKKELGDEIKVINIGKNNG